MNAINFISLQVKCPHCSKSLMDDINFIDNEPSIKLLVESEGKSGTLNLSSIYGSYNYLSDLDFKENSVSKFSCPHCREELNTTDKCKTCDASTVTLILDIGGKVSFCSRKGCQDHNIGFEDLSVALKKMYLDFEQGTKVKFKQEDIVTPEKVKVKTESELHKEIIESGSFLNVYCPHCNKSLIDDEMLKLRIVNEKKEEGYIMLSPYLNVFSSKSTIYLPEEKELSDIKCYHCDKSLKLSDTKCEKCGTSIAKVLVGARTKMIDFFICSKKGCTWHGLSKRDLDDIRLEDSNEW